jgi:hypothetical protein
LLTTVRKMPAAIARIRNGYTLVERFRQLKIELALLALAVDRQIASVSIWEAIYMTKIAVLPKQFPFR